MVYESGTSGIGGAVRNLEPYRTYTDSQKLEEEVRTNDA
jgi:hypothetical protein